MKNDTMIQVEDSPQPSKPLSIATSSSGPCTAVLPVKKERRQGALTKQIVRQIEMTIGLTAVANEKSVVDVISDGMPSATSIASSSAEEELQQAHDILVMKQELAKLEIQKLEVKMKMATARRSRASRSSGSRSACGEPIAEDAVCNFGEPTLQKSENLFSLEKTTLGMRSELTVPLARKR